MGNRGLAAIAALLVTFTGCASQPGGLSSSPPGAVATATPKSAIDPDPATVAPRSSPMTQPPSPAENLSLAELSWYEVERVGDLHGNQSRTLIYGSLDGQVHGRLPLSQQAPEQREGGGEPFRWVDPQIAGIFDGQVLVWGRDGQLSRLETVDLQTGVIHTLVEADGAIHVATADNDLSTAFLVTVEEGTGVPTGLWMLPTSDSEAKRLDYAFASEAVSNRFMYRLAASDDGQLLAIQADEDAVTLLNVATGDSEELDPGGSIVGFGEGSLVSLTAEGATGLRSVVVFDPTSLNGEVVAEEVSAAQVIHGTDGDLVAAMSIDPDNPTAFVIRMIEIASGESQIAHVHDQPTAGAMLPREDRSFIGVKTPPDWVALIETFRPFIVVDGSPAKEVPDSQRPRLLNLRTGEVQVVGPFTEG